MQHLIIFAVIFVAGLLEYVADNQDLFNKVKSTTHQYYLLNSPMQVGWRRKYMQMSEMTYIGDSVAINAK